MIMGSGRGSPSEKGTLRPVCILVYYLKYHGKDELHPSAYTKSSCIHCRFKSCHKSVLKEMIPESGRYQTCNRRKTSCRRPSHGRTMYMMRI